MHGQSLLLAKRLRGDTSPIRTDTAAPPRPTTDVRGDSENARPGEGTTQRGLGAQVTAASTPGSYAVERRCSEGQGGQSALQDRR